MQANMFSTKKDEFKIEKNIHLELMNWHKSFINLFLKNPMLSLGFNKSGHRMSGFFTVLSAHLDPVKEKEIPMESLSKVHVDKYLVLMGLLSVDFKNYVAMQRSCLQMTHQLFALIFQWIMTIKWLVCIFIFDEQILVGLGDFTMFLPGKRIYYQVNH